MASSLKDPYKARIALFIFVSVVAVVFYWRLGAGHTPGDKEVKTGHYRLEDGLFEEAEKEFESALAKDPDHVNGHLGLALTYMQTKRNDDALREFNRVIELDPNIAVAWADRGILYDRSGLYEKALSDYKKALTLDAEGVEGPGFLWRFMRNISKKQPEIRDRAIYLAKELAKPAEERVLRVEKEDEKMRMHRK